MIVHVYQYDRCTQRGLWALSNLGGQHSSTISEAAVETHGAEIRDSDISVMSLCGQSQFGPVEKEEETLPSHFLPSVPQLTQCLSHLMREI